MADQSVKDFVEETNAPTASPEMRDGESVFLKGYNNQLILYGRDRPGAIDSGYHSETDAGTIHIITGRKDVDPSFKDDKSFMYITMKTDVDANLDVNNEGGQGAYEQKAGPAVIAKSDNVRIIFREQGDIRISSDDGKNFIVVDSKGCEIKIGSSWLKMTDGEITIEAGAIKLGSGATIEKMVCGTAFQTYFMAHSHQSPVGPCSPPLQPWTPNLLSTKSILE